jgi:VanZ family protein
MAHPMFSGGALSTLVGSCHPQEMVRLLPPLCWTGLIAWLGSGYWSGVNTSSWLYPTLRAIFPRASPVQIETIHFFIRKAAHVLEYAVLSGLWRRALGGWRVPLLLCLLTAILDEVRQTVTPGRSGALADVLLDGAASAVVLMTYWPPRFGRGTPS